jgi:hypothetical protein
MNKKDLSDIIYILAKEELRYQEKTKRISELIKILIEESKGDTTT